MRNLSITLALGTLPLMAAFASAQETERYRLEKTDQGYVRMDTQTGEMSICEQQAGQLVCRVAADERSALQDEIDRLNASLKSLEGRVAALEKEPAVTALPTDEEFEKTMNYMERFFRGFMDIVKDFEDEKDGVPQQQKT